MVYVIAGIVWIVLVFLNGFMDLTLFYYEDPGLKKLILLILKFCINLTIGGVLVFFGIDQIEKRDFEEFLKKSDKKPPEEGP